MFFNTLFNYPVYLVCLYKAFENDVIYQIII